MSKSKSNLPDRGVSVTSSPTSSQQLLAYAQATYSWEAGQKTEDELLQRIWNLADDVGRLVEQLEAAQNALRNIAVLAEQEVLSGPPELGLILGEARIALDSNPASRRDV